jgi:hypothetical protein
MTTNFRDQTPTRLAAATRAALDREWGLFCDWCSSWELDPIPATADTVGAFLAAFPAARSTQALRVRAIRHRHAAAGFVLDLPGLGAKPSVLWRTDDETLLDVAAAVGQLPRYRFPVGLRGRRDAFVLVAAGSAGLTREQIHRLTPDAITGVGDSILLAGQLVPWDEDPARCPRCAVVRWLRVLGPAWAGDRSRVRDILDVTRAIPDRHDCEDAVDPGWRRVEHLVVALDTHGWVRPGVGLSTRTITTLIAPHRSRTGFVEDTTVRELTGGRFAALSGDELYGEQDDVDARVAELLLRSADLIRDAETIDARLRAHDINDAPAP